LHYNEAVIIFFIGYISNTLDTLGVIARSIGKEHFAPLAATSLDLGIKLLRNTIDPDLRKSLYGLFAAISTVMKKEMAVTLPEIVEYMIMSIQSADGILVIIAQIMKVEKPKKEYKCNIVFTDAF